MTVVQQLFDLLGIDTELDQHKQSIASIDQTLADNRLLINSQKAVEETQAALRKQEAEHKDIELAVESMQVKGKQIEDTLYGGTVRNPRELQDFQTELNLLREQQKRQEESLLRLLEAIEGTEKELENQQATLSQVQTAREHEHEQLLKEKSQLQERSSVLEEKRQSLSSLVSPEHLKLYDFLRTARQGQAVAKVERGMCHGCRISLPTRIVQQARMSQKPMQCPNCSRILYVT